MKVTIDRLEGLNIFLNYSLGTHNLQNSLEKLKPDVIENITQSNSDVC